MCQQRETVDAIHTLRHCPIDQTRLLTFEEVSPLVAERWHLLTSLPRTELISELTGYAQQFSVDDPRTGMPQSMSCVSQLILALADT
jgi:hypothetical protein